MAGGFIIDRRKMGIPPTTSVFFIMWTKIVIHTVWWYNLKLMFFNNVIELYK